MAQMERTSSNNSAGLSSLPCAGDASFHNHSTNSANKSGSNPNLLSDCWKSPLCPRNAAAKAIAEGNGTASSHTHINCGGTSHTASAPSSNNTPEVRESIETTESPAAKGTERPKMTRKDSATGKPSKKIPHTVIEKRYRDNFNRQVEDLRSAIPFTACLQDMEDVGNAPRPHTKAAVIATAIEYMRQLRTQHEQVVERNKAMQQKLESLQKLLACEGCSIMQYAVNSGLLAGQNPG